MKVIDEYFNRIRMEELNREIYNDPIKLYNTKDTRVDIDIVHINTPK